MGIRSGRTRAEDRAAGRLPGNLAVDLRRIKPFRETVRYGYAVGRIRVLEAQIVGGQRLRRMIEADYEEALRILDEVPLGDYLVDAATAKRVDEGLTAFLGDVYDAVGESLPGDSRLLTFFRCRYDFHNLKALLKAEAGGAAAEGLLPGLGTVDPVSLRKGLETPAFLPAPYRETILDCREREAGPGGTDAVVDGHFLAYRLALARTEGSPFILDFARASIDLANLKLALRGRELGWDRDSLEVALVSGGFIEVGQMLDLHAEGREEALARLGGSRYYSGLFQALGGLEQAAGLTVYDRASDDLLMDLVRGTKRVSIGVEPVFAYLRARENEVLTVRMLLMGKLNGVPPEVIEEHLRKPYID